jgi:hypothetical protein
MKFPMNYPDCKYPRLVFSVRNDNNFSGDEGLGNAVVSLRKLLKQLLKEGAINLEHKKVPLTHVDFPG